MDLLTAKLTELNRLSVRTDSSVQGVSLAELSVTAGGLTAQVAGVASHGDTLGFDLFLAKELELGEPVRITLGESSVFSSIDYHLYNTQAFESKYFYGGTLGAAYSPKSTLFQLWAPAASAVTLLLFSRAEAKPYKLTALSRGARGVFAATVDGDLDGVLYAYDVTSGGVANRCVDPYARASIENGRMGVVVNPRRTNPPRWERDSHILPQNPTDAVLYEIHVRDFTISSDSGVTHKGKFLGFAEDKTVSPQGEKTGLAHLKELGITHVHLMPVMDYATVDETGITQQGYNWGYDPFSYFVPDGSYCTDPSDGALRIRECKALVQALHQAGIGVVLDVVYNHTYFTDTSPLNLVMPDYYYRKSAGCFSNGSGCGNELASERGMVRRLMIDSLLYWVNEYHVDGFRFDLMGLHDIATMNYIRHKLDEIDGRILIYGEGWQGGPSSLPSEKAAIKQNSEKLSDRIALFNDDMRDAIKGNAFDACAPGYLGGALDSRVYAGFTELIKAGVAGASPHPHVMYSSGTSPFAKRPTQTITYNSAHDNYTLFDKLALANPALDEDTLIRLNKLAAVLVLTAQGIPFLHGGEELLRQKIREDGTFEHNSYNSPDSVNRIEWRRKHEHRGVFDYYRGLIAFRNAHKALRMTTAEDTASFLRFLYTQPENRLCYRLAAAEAGDIAQRIVVIINPTRQPFDCRFVSENESDASGYCVYADAERAGSAPLYPVETETVTVPPLSAMILVKD